ncbi:hypothetical protein QYF61_007060 [Mycteria americana]|uniref:Gag-pol polyprotein n=1 Tax=Mycteria americana TaxID=33587 RepID=A0AAN7N7X7_MYCAM|nr:hypothetical protein QYF61_007060 [Mycteria americana]
MASSITDYLRRHGVNPSPTFSAEWTHDNWHNWEAIEEHLKVTRGHTKDGKGKGIICKMLGACLEAAHQERDNRNKKEQDLEKEIEGRKATELLLSLKIEQLQKQLQEEKEKRQKLGEKVEMMLIQAPHPPGIVQIRKLIVSPEDWDGDIWGDPDDSEPEDDNPLFPTNPPEYEARPIVKTERTGGTAGHEVKKRVVSGRQLGLPVQKVEAYQWISDNGPYILIPAGPQRQLVKFLIDTGAQISLLTQQDAEKLGVRPRRQRVKITGVNGVSVQCETAKVNLWLPGEKHMLSTRFAIKDHHENILGFDVLNGRTWRLPNGSVWSFGSNIDPNPSRNREAPVRALCAAPALPESKITNVLQYPISAAARNGISEVIADLEKRQISSRTHSPYNSPVWPIRKPDGRWRLTVDYRRLNANTAPLTAAVPNIANLTATLQAAAHPWMAALDIKDMFFMVPLKEEDKEKFAFTWEGIQYTFNRLPQGYQHSPTIAQAVLAELLQTVLLP